jgi:hypothetical protein
MRNYHYLLLILLILTSCVTTKGISKTFEQDVINKQLILTAKYGAVLPHNESTSRNLLVQVSHIPNNGYTYRLLYKPLNPTDEIGEYNGIKATSRIPPKEHNKVVAEILSLMYSYNIDPVFIDSYQGKYFNEHLISDTILYYDTLGSNFRIGSYVRIKSDSTKNRFYEEPERLYIDFTYFGDKHLSPIAAFKVERERVNWTNGLEAKVDKWYNDNHLDWVSGAKQFDRMMSVLQDKMDSYSEMVQRIEGSKRSWGSMLAEALDETKNPTPALPVASSYSSSSVSTTTKSSSTSYTGTSGLNLTSTSKDVPEATNTGSVAEYSERNGLFPIFVHYGPGTNYPDYASAYQEAKRRYLEYKAKYNIPKFSAPPVGSIPSSGKTPVGGNQ